MTTNTTEKGATVIGSDTLLSIGSKGGIAPDESTFSIFPFRSKIWLCKFPFLGVRWYSSLSILYDVVENFVLRFWNSCCKFQVSELEALCVETRTWTVVLLSRFIISNVIPCWNINGDLFNCLAFYEEPEFETMNTRFCLQFSWNNEHRHAAWLAQKSLWTGHCFPLIGAKVEHCKAKMNISLICEYFRYVLIGLR